MSPCRRIDLIPKGKVYTFCWNFIFETSFFHYMVSVDDFHKQLSACSNLVDILGPFWIFHTNLKHSQVHSLGHSKQQFSNVFYL